MLLQCGTHLARRCRLPDDLLLLLLLTSWWALLDHLLASHLNPNLSLLRENSLLVETPTRAPAQKQPLPQPQHQSNLHQRSIREKRDPPAEKSQATPGLLPPAATARWKSSRSDPVGPAAVEPAGPPAALPLAPAGGHLQGFALAGGNIQISSA